jgi:coatomer protein complex subunit epsilon
MSLDADPLFNEKNLFYRGDYKGVIAEQEKPGMEQLLLRAQIEVDPKRALQQLGSSKDAFIKACGALCQVKLGKTQEAEKTVQGLLSSAEPAVQIVVATVLARIERFEEALDVLGSLDENLEAAALQIHIYLAMGQLAQAQSVLESAQRWSNNEELVQLAEGWIMMRQGGDRLNAASYTFEELAEVSPMAARLLVAQGSAALASADVDTAEQLFKRALDKDATQADALANLLVLAAVQGEDAAAMSKARDALTEADAHHPLIKDLDEKKAEFESLTKNYKFVKAS